MTSSRSQTELVTEPGTVAKSFGLIVQRSFHHTLLSPWCAICFLAQVTQMCSLAKWTVQGSKRLFSSQNLPCIRPNRGVVFLVTLPQPAHRDVPPGGALSAHQACQSLTYTVLWYRTSVDSKSEQMVLSSARLSTSLLQTTFLSQHSQTMAGGTLSSAKQEGRTVGNDMIEKENILPSCSHLWY